jgi:hypothetical protein
MQAAQEWEQRSRVDARSSGELRAKDWQDYDKAMRWLVQERGEDPITDDMPDYGADQL